MEKKKLINEKQLKSFSKKKYLKRNNNMKILIKKSKQVFRRKKSKTSVKNYLLIFLSLIFIIELSYISFVFIFKKHIDDSYNSQSKTKVGLCVICKGENLYIEEFVNHYKKIGYNHIFIYDNNDIDGEKFDNVLKKEIKDNYVSIVDFRGKNSTRQIFEAYIDCYEKNNKNYDWLSFFDIDEFLELKNNTNIQELLDNERYKNCQNVKFNWLIYSDNDKLYYENKPVQERFTEPLYHNGFFNMHIKSTVRGNLPKNYWLNSQCPHTSINEFIACSCSGKEIDKKSPYNWPPDYKYAILKHYRTKTIEEYCNKMKKGKPDAKINYKRMVDWFFKTSKITDEKINYFNKVFNITFHKRKKSGVH